MMFTQTCAHAACAHARSGDPLGSGSTHVIVTVVLLENNYLVDAFVMPSAAGRRLHEGVRTRSGAHEQYNQGCAASSAPSPPGSTMHGTLRRCQRSTAMRRTLSHASTQMACVVISSVPGRAVLHTHLYTRAPSSGSNSCRLQTPGRSTPRQHTRMHWPGGKRGRAQKERTSGQFLRTRFRVSGLGFRVRV